MAEDRWLWVLNLGLTEFNHRGAERTENEHGDGGSNRLEKMRHGGMNRRGTQRREPPGGAEEAGGIY
ncbi:MAG: hypothetical protein ACYDHX_10135 [Methanothrix sp.]